MRGAHSRRPRLGVVGTFCAGWAAILMLEFPLEMLAVHTGLVGYPGTIPELTLWAGRTDQLPLYGPLLWSATLASLGMLRFYRDDRGRTVVERGIDRVPFGTRTTTALRALAVLGFIHISMILCYDVPINLAGLYAGPAQTYPSYLRTTQCGADAPVPVECPGPASPILVDRR
jgi:hypothetical protein